MEIEAHAEDLASDLGVDKQEVEESLRNLVEYSVPIDEAKQSIRRKYGDGDGGEPAGPTTVEIADVGPESGNVTVTVRVLTVGKRPIRYRGEDHVIFEGELADGTGTISYTAWEDFGLEPGDTVTVANASVREYEGAPEINFGESSSVEFHADPLDVDAPIGGDAALADLEPGDRGVTVEVAVVEAEDRTIDGRDGETRIRSGVLGDETARLPFTDWEPRDAVAEGAAVRIENAYVREFRGVPSVNLSEFSRVTPLDREVEAGGPTRLSIREAIDRGGTYDLEVVGDVLEVRDGSGIVQRCPECNRIVQNGRCRTHGDVDPVDDLRTKAIVDDGSGSLTAVFDAEATAEIYGGDLEDARAEAREAMDQSVVADAIRAELVGRPFRLRGHLSVDEYGATLEVVSFDPDDSDPVESGRALLAEVGE